MMGSAVPVGFLQRISEKLQKALDNSFEKRYTVKAVRECCSGCGLVAQLDRVFDYESKGRRFESCRDHQFHMVP